MPQQCPVWLLWALLFAWLLGSAASKSVEHSDLFVYAFSSLQAYSSGDSFPPYPEGMKLELTCQAAARHTFWYKRRPSHDYPVSVEDKLRSESSSPISGVFLSVFTIPHLEKKDNGSELWCTMDGSSIKKVVHLTVVGPPSPLEIEYIKKGDGLELKCSSQKVDRHLELCWYRDDEKLQCKFLGKGESPPTTVTTYIPPDDLVEEMTLVCKARLREDRGLETLTKETHEHFTAMLKKASVEVMIVGRELAACHDDEPESKSPSTKTFTLRNPDTNLCRKVNINEHRITTTAPSTSPMATITTPASNEDKQSTPNRNGGTVMAVTTLPLLMTLCLVVLL